jgi:hypothetical protein
VPETPLSPEEVELLDDVLVHVRRWLTRWGGGLDRRRLRRLLWLVMRDDPAEDGRRPRLRVVPGGRPLCRWSPEWAPHGR